MNFVVLYYYNNIVMPVFREILSNTCQSVSPATPECSVPKNCQTRKECIQERKKGMSYIGFRQTIFFYFFYFYFPPLPFCCRQVDRWTFLIQSLHPPSPSSRTFSANNGWESIFSLSSGSWVLEQCVFCLRGATYTRNLDKLLVSV